MNSVAKETAVKRPMHQRNNLYIALGEDGVNIDFIWDLDEVLEFDRLWEEGYCLWDIAHHFGRRYDDVLVLALDRSIRGKISVRPGGAYGTKRMGVGKNYVKRTPLKILDCLRKEGVMIDD